MKASSYLIRMLFFSLASLIFGCRKESSVTDSVIVTPEPGADYFPLNVGNKWVFDFYKREYYAGGYSTIYEGKEVWEVVSKSFSADTIRYLINESFTGQRIHSEFYTPPTRTDTTFFTDYPGYFSVVQKPDSVVDIEKGSQNLDNQLLNVLHLARIKRYGNPTNAPDTLEIRDAHIIYFVCSVSMLKNTGIVSYEIGEGGNHTWYTKASLDTYILK